MQTPPAIHIRGTVEHVRGNTATIATDRGPVTVTIAPNAGFAKVTPGSRADIKPGTFIGTANVQSGNSGRALEVVVFPNSMRGTGEGNYRWDLGPSSSGHSMMTNGTVASQGHSMMTNGNVKSASGSGAMKLDVTYKGGSEEVTVPANVPVVLIGKGSRDLLKSGAHVFVVATGPASHLTAARIVVGVDGATPPM